MGVDCRIYLPPDTRVGDVAKVLGLLAGLPGELKPLGGASGGIYLDVPGAQVKSSEPVPECAAIHFGDHYVLYHFEGDGPGYNPAGGPASVIMLPPSTPFWCGIAKGLVEFFGGVVDFNDSDDSDRDLEVERPRPWNNPCDGEPWDTFQREMAAVKPAEPLPEVAAYT